MLYEGKIKDGVKMAVCDHSVSEDSSRKYTYSCNKNKNKRIYFYLFKHYKICK